MIISILNRNGGFFTQFFSTLNHYICAEKNKSNFKIDTSEWTYKYKNGWEDYFINYDETMELSNDIENIFYAGHCQFFGHYNVKDYIFAIDKLYKLNDFVKKNIKNIIDIYDLKGEYGGIYVRRGDKLISESRYYDTKIYIETLLKYDNNIKKIFVQTDDYSVYLEIKDYIIKNNLDIEIITTCDENTFGMVIYNSDKELIEKNLENMVYKNYLAHDNIKNFKPIDKYDSEEILSHTLELLTGIEILRYSKICVLDYQSNVSRFIKLSHTNFNNVIDINGDNNINMDRLIYPTFSLN